MRFVHKGVHGWWGGAGRQATCRWEKKRERTSSLNPPRGHHLAVLRHLVENLTASPPEKFPREWRAAFVCRNFLLPPLSGNSQDRGIVGVTNRPHIRPIYVVQLRHRHCCRRRRRHSRSFRATTNAGRWSISSLCRQVVGEYPRAQAGKQAGQSDLQSAVSMTG